MSICFYARVNKKCITEDLLFHQINEFFQETNEIKRRKSKDCINFENIFANDDIIISFFEEKKTPYNVYEFNMLDNEFEYKQEITSDIKKEMLSKEYYKLVIVFCESLEKEIKNQILITSDVHNEICLINNDKIEWFNSIFIFSRNLSRRRIK